MVDRPKLQERLEQHEGFSPYVYKDSLGYDTFGFGFCIDKKVTKGISKDMARVLLKLKMEEKEKELEQFDFYKVQDDVRKEVLIEMNYNIGLPKLLKFKKTLQHFLYKNYDKAVEEMKDSLWAKQIGKNRLNNILQRTLTGKY